MWKEVKWLVIWLLQLAKKTSKQDEMLGDNIKHYTVATGKKVKLSLYMP